jgi:CheY-like chemotaxis protein
MTVVIPSILITDDDTAFRETLQSMLEPFGYQFSFASDGEEALRIIDREKIHLLLLDMHMPRLSGLETIRRIRQKPLRLPCILLSAGLNEQIKQQAQCLEAFSVLPKPVTRQIITDTVQLALQRNYGWPQDPDHHSPN